MHGGWKSGRVWFALGAALVAGCAAAGKQSPPTVSEQVAAPTVSPVVWNEPEPLPNAVSKAGAIPAPHPEVSQPLQLLLFDAVEMGLAQNPDLVALRTAEGVSEGMLDVAATYPFNPWVQIQVTPSQTSAVSNTGPVSHYVLLMQQLQLCHQRQHRADAAAAALNSVRWNYVQAKLLNMAQTQRLFFSALYQREIAELARANAELNTQLLSISQKQLEAGAIAGADVAILRLDNASARRQAALADASYQTAVLDLKRHLGVPPTAPVAVSGRLADWKWQAVTSETAAWLPLACVEMPVTTD